MLQNAMPYVSIDEIYDIEFTGAGQTQSVTGYVGYSTEDVYNPGGQLRRPRPLLYKVELFVNDAIEDSEIFNPEARSEVIRTDKTGQEFAFDWAIQGTGEYTLTVVATLRTDHPEGGYDPDDPQWFFTDYDDYIEVQVVLPQETVYVEPMAAPAVAGKILKYNDVKPNQSQGKGKDKVQINLISEVARHMGPQTCFEGVAKSVWVNGIEVSNGYYWDEVLEYLLGRISTLKMPTNDWLIDNGLGMLYYP